MDFTKSAFRASRNAASKLLENLRDLQVYSSSSFNAPKNFFIFINFVLPFLILFLITGAEEWSAFFLPLFSLLDFALLLLRAEEKEAAALQQQQNLLDEQPLQQPSSDYEAGIMIMTNYVTLLYFRSIWYTGIPVGDWWEKWYILLKYKLKESALVNVNRTDVLSKSIHLGVNWYTLLSK